MQSSKILSSSKIPASNLNVSQKSNDSELVKATVTLHAFFTISSSVGHVCSASIGSAIISDCNDVCRFMSGLNVIPDALIPTQTCNYQASKTSYSAAYKFLNWTSSNFRPCSTVTLSYRYIIYSESFASDSI